MKLTILLATALFASTVSANDYGIALAPGEVLIAVDGVPVNRAVIIRQSAFRTPIRSVAAPVIFAPVKAAARVMRCTVDRFGNRSCR